MDEVRNIVATFVKKDPAEIGDNTLINKRVVSGSILVHRMYAAINNAGYAIKDYNDINTYGELLARLNGTPATSQAVSSAPRYSPAPTIEKATGIDIEDISNFPLVADFREDDFYVSNFTSQEIAYCILKGKPMESFAGLFCAKEALCKTNEHIRQIPFNEIEIKHDDNGKPVYSGYTISIAHTSQFAIAVAIANEGGKPQPAVNSELNNLAEKQDLKIAALRRMVFFSLLIAILAVILCVVLLNKSV